MLDNIIRLITVSNIFLYKPKLITNKIITYIWFKLIYNDIFQYYSKLTFWHSTVGR